ncbi:MAG: tRNA (adenosine(37)-N6)-threonylcarbamoyltransferase complex transferase subunit TsaD, partial [Myxococcota bacterium]
MTRNLERPLVWGIETSCDDTACALVDGAGRVVASVVSSQLAAHAPYGGVVPEIASREHLANWSAVAGEAFARAGV